ncbi:MAG: right-handed parallel beta-helix repeat-containing protein [Armatimonadetes bacterium]|nr:right-handed parallel beta-helix repeat-containing protein [Armatimonadota bacterium]
MQKPSETRKSTTLFYVAPDGNDAWSGALARANAKKTDGPFATPSRARDAVRALRSKGKLSGPVTVYLREGRYTLSEPLIFTPEDSGSADAPVVYAAFRSESPVLSGGRVIAGWKKGEGQTWTVEIPEVKSGRWYFRQLFVDGLRRTRARMPLSGYYRMEGQPSTDDPARFKYRNNDIRPEWAERGDVEVVSLAKWAGFRYPLRTVDPATKTVTLPGKVFEHIRENDQRYFIENAREGLDSPGEWHLDRKTGVLTYWPMPYEEMGEVTVIAPALTELVRFAGDPASGKPVRNVTLKGLTFSHTDWAMGEKGYLDMQAAYDIPAAVEANGAVSCALERNLFVHLGNYAVQFARGCKNNRIVGNEMTDLGAGGVKVGEPRIHDDETEQTSGHHVTDNHIHNIGIVYPTAIGVWIGQSSDNRIAHNHIHDTYYSAISVGWTWGYGKTNARGNVIEYNHCHDLGRGLLSDMGGIYTLGVQPGTVIRNNVFHDVTSHDYGGWGIYPDEGSSQLLIENNIVFRTKSGGFHQHYGRDNLVRNNIFALAFGEQGQLIRTRQEPHLSFTLEGNIVYWKDGPLLGDNWSGDETYRIDRNLYWKQGQPIEFKGASLEAWRERGHDVHSLIADPLFVNPERGDFRLKPGSPAEKIGFRPIDVSKVGPRKTHSRGGYTSPLSKKR